MFGLLDHDNYFEAYLADGEKYLFDLHRKCIVRTARKIYHGDWKSIYPRDPIPANTEVEIIGHFFNFYGHHLTVLYDNTKYDISQDDLYYARLEDK